MRDLIRLIEEMDRELRRIGWQDVVIFCVAAGLVCGWVSGVWLGWW